MRGNFYRDRKVRGVPRTRVKKNMKIIFGNYIIPLKILCFIEK